MSQKDIGNKIPLSELKTGKEVELYYDEWAKNNKYNIDLADWNYSGPNESVDLFTKYNFKKNIKIMAAGCGSGLVGIELKKKGFTNIDGADFSQKMLDLIPNNTYQNIYKIDFNQKLNIKDNQYQGMMCIGSFTFAHINSSVLSEMVRISDKGSFICFTINPGVYEDYGFDKKIKELEDNKSWKIIEFYKSNYLASKDVNAWLLIAEVI